MDDSSISCEAYVFPAVAPFEPRVLAIKLKERVLHTYLAELEKVPYVLKSSLPISGIVPEQGDNTTFYVYKIIRSSV